MKLSHTIQLSVAVIALIFAVSRPVLSANVTVTPLGSNKGEFCQLDRAMLFEDPDGTRIEGFEGEK